MYDPSGGEWENPSSVGVEIPLQNVVTQVGVENSTLQVLPSRPAQTLLFEPVRSCAPRDLAVLCPRLHQSPMNRINMSPEREKLALNLVFDRQLQVESNNAQEIMARRPIAVQKCGGRRPIEDAPSSAIQQL